MRVSKWGNSLAVRLPATVISVLGLKDGDDIQIRIEDQRAFTVKKKPGVQDHLAALRKFRGRLPADFSFDRGTANARR